MALKVNGFPGCCGSVVITNFYSDVYHTGDTLYRSPHFMFEQESQMKNFFRDKFDDMSMGGGPWCKKVGFVHAVLNQYQMLNEPLLLKYGFVKINSTVNTNTKNWIHHYLLINNQPSKEKKLERRVKSLFGPVEIAA